MTRFLRVYELFNCGTSQMHWKLGELSGFPLCFCLQFVSHNSYLTKNKQVKELQKKRGKGEKGKVIKNAAGYSRQMRLESQVYMNGTMAAQSKL